MKHLGLMVACIISLSGCATSQVAEITSNQDECMAPLSTDPQYAVAHAILSPQGGVFPSMLANQEYPTPEHLAMFGPYLDLKSRCQRATIDAVGTTSLRSDARYNVLQKQSRLKWNNYAALLSGRMTYGQYFAASEQINAAFEDQFASIESEQKRAEAEYNAQQAAACTASGGGWMGGVCIPARKPPTPTIYCTHTDSTTTCR